MRHGPVPGPVGIFIKIQNGAMPEAVNPGMNTDFFWGYCSPYQQRLEP